MPTDYPSRILIVDDTPANLHLLGTALSRDFELQVATSGAQGLAIAAQDPPDLILLDVMMPGMDGYETCRRLKADPRLRKIPVIFISAMSELAAESAGLALGAADYITKPLNVEIASQRIRNLLEREGLQKEVERHRDHLEELVAARTLALSIAKEAAEAANRAKSNFLTNISEELRTPLSGFMGMTDLALRRASDPKQKQQLTQAKSAAQRLLAALSVLLDVAQLDAAQLHIDSVDFTLEGVLDKLRSLAGYSAQAKGLTLRIDVPCELRRRTLRGDPLRLGQLLFQLTANAIQFSSEGSVAVDAQVAAETVSDLLLRVAVRDTGSGIAEAEQRRLFSGSPPAAGAPPGHAEQSGLGLALSKRLTQAMGGDIGVESQLGVGSTFWFTTRLKKPLLTIGKPTALLSPEETLKARHPGARILLAAADPVSQEILRMLMEDAGLLVELANDSSELLAKATGGDYALILLDVDLPASYGVDPALAIRALPGRQSPPILGLPGPGRSPLLAWSAPLSAEDRARSLAAGMSDFIARPFTPEILFAALLLWLDRHS